jgi:hypothetical protein
MSDLIPVACLNSLDGCTCDHPESWHDDGFGCTEQDCECLASWTIEWIEV